MATPVLETVAARIKTVFAGVEGVAVVYDELLDVGKIKLFPAICFELQSNEGLEDGVSMMRERRRVNLDIILYVKGTMGFSGRYKLLQLEENLRTTIRTDKATGASAAAVSAFLDWVGPLNVDEYDPRSGDSVSGALCNQNIEIEFNYP